MSEKSVKYEVDNVNSPPHYTKGKFETIDVIEDIVDELPGKEAVAVANVIKYISRYKYKNGIEDVKKARWYIERLIDTLEEDDIELPVRAEVSI